MDTRVIPKEVSNKLTYLTAIRMSNKRDYNKELKDTAEHKYSYNFDFDVMHPFMLKSFIPFFKDGNLLELGSFKGDFTRRLAPYFKDITCVEASDEAIKIAHDHFGNKVKFYNSLFEEVKLATQFDNIILTHVLEHIYKPHLALKEWERVLKNGGVLSILIPTDPGVAWRLSRHLGPRKNAIAQGIAYDYVMAREHVNACNNLIALLRHYFPDHAEAWWPFPIPSIDLNLFFVFHALINKQGK